jgi:hypothetical protein
VRLFGVEPQGDRKLRPTLELSGKDEQFEEQRYDIDEATRRGRNEVRSGVTWTHWWVRGNPTPAKNGNFPPGESPTGSEKHVEQNGTAGTIDVGGCSNRTRHPWFRWRKPDGPGVSPFSSPPGCFSIPTRIGELPTALPATLTARALSGK